MTLGERIKSRRFYLGYSQQEVADLAEISQIQVSRYEANENMPTSEALIGLARALEVSADWILGINERMGIDGLSELEKQALTLFRSKPPERQLSALEILRHV